MKTKLGAPKAITAAAHKLARIFYHLWSRCETYSDPGVEAYQQQYRERTLKQLQRKAQALGLCLPLVTLRTSMFLRRSHRHPSGLC